MPLIPARFVSRPLLLAAALIAGAAVATPRAQSDLDTFMKQVVEQRDANWRRLQQYVLDERERIDLRGPNAAPLWGEQRDYTWYIRDGFFVRSPLRVNGTPVPEADRLKYEGEFLARAQARDSRDAGAAPTLAPPTVEAPRDVDGLIRQTRQPQFISSAYFLRFTFDEGRYALVGRESLDDVPVLKVEYYPNRLFTPDARRERREDTGNERRERRAQDAREQSMDAEMMRLMNRASKVTLWVEPTAHQIVKYTFDDLGWNFFPGQWLAQVDGVTASMEMGQAFPGVWLPRRLDMRMGMMMALGRVEFRYGLQYENYRQPDVQSKVGIPGVP